MIPAGSCINNMAASQEAAAQPMLGEDPQQTGDALLEVSRLCCCIKQCEC